MPETDLRALRDKYERMLRLRLLHARAREEPGFVEPDPREAMAELARDFPGALREIDELPVDVIRQRIAALAAAEVDTSRAEAWMRAHASFHRHARGALAAKRWLEGRPATPDLIAAFARALPTLQNAKDAAAWADDLAVVASPPRGRVMDLVYQRVAAELDIDVAAARASVMPSRRSRRGA